MLLQGKLGEKCACFLHKFKNCTKGFLIVVDSAASGPIFLPESIKWQGRKKGSFGLTSHLPWNQHRKTDQIIAHYFILFCKEVNNDLASVIAIVCMWLQIHWAWQKVAEGCVRHAPGPVLQSTKYLLTRPCMGFCAVAMLPNFKGS